jgi:hypothetical protein
MTSIATEPSGDVKSHRIEKHITHGKKKWTIPDFLKSPLILALVGLLGTGVGASLQGFWSVRLERQKFEAEMIKLALQEKSQDDKANFLNFLRLTQVVTQFHLGDIEELAKKGKLPHLSGAPPSGSFFPSVEHDTADYTIELNSTGGASWLLNFTFRRLREEATMLADMIATSGPPPQVRSDTHNLTVVMDPSRPKGQPNLDRYIALLDISREQLDFPRQASLRYVTEGGFGGENSKQWAGVLALQPTRKATVKIVFQPNRIGSDFRFSTYQWSAPSNAVQPLEQEEFRLDGNVLIWSFQSPRLNHVYRVDWNW